MIPITFPEANCIFTNPPDLDESQCMSIPAYQGEVSRGAIEGSHMVVVAWTPTFEELTRIIAGVPIYISMMGGLAPHYLSTTFHEATHPA